jgi:hypothetical protein
MKNLVVKTMVAAVILNISITSCSKENLHQGPVNKILHQSNVIVDTPYKENPINIIDTPYVAPPTNIIDTPYVFVNGN